MRPASEPGCARARPGRVSRARRWSAWIDGSRAAYERMGMPPAFQWARLKADVQCALRKGAWYRILKLTSIEVVLDVRGKPLSVPRGQLQLSSEPALRWSVVPSPKHTARFPATWGASYAVCPNCRDRAKLEGHPASMRCQRCNGSFEIAWNESSRGVAERDASRVVYWVKMVNELLDADLAPGAAAWRTYPAPDVLITRSPNSAMPLTGATLNVPDNRPPTGFTLILMVMLPAKAESGMPRLSRTST